MSRTLLSREPERSAVVLVRRESRTSRSSSRLLFLRFLLSIALPCAVAMPASASSEAREERTELVASGVDALLAMVASNDVCNAKCRYEGPDIVTERKLGYAATADRYYKWTHIHKVRHTKFFSVVTVERGQATVVKRRVLEEKKDAALIAELEEKTGLDHSPIFDAGITTYRMSPADQGMRLHVEARATVSGPISLFMGQVRAGLRDSVSAVFNNLK